MMEPPPPAPVEAPPPPAPVPVTAPPPPMASYEQPRPPPGPPKGSGGHGGGGGYGDRGGYGGGGGGGYRGSFSHGLSRDPMDRAPVDLARVNDLLTQRNDAKRQRDFDTADRLRDQLKQEMNVEVYDKDFRWKVPAQEIT